MKTFWFVIWRVIAPGAGLDNRVSPGSQREFGRPGAWFGQQLGRNSGYGRAPPRNDVLPRLPTLRLALECGSQSRRTRGRRRPLQQLSPGANFARPPWNEMEKVTMKFRNTLTAVLGALALGFFVGKVLR